MRIGFFLFVIVLSLSYTFGQNESCPEKLLRAASAYNQGNFELTFQLANSYKTSPDESDQVQAYRLLSMMYLAILQKDKAIEAAEKMLTIQPEYEPDLLNDPKEFTLLLKQVNIIPKFTFGLSAMYGFNWTTVNVQGFYAPADYKKSYKGKKGYQIGAVFGYNLNEKQSLQLNILNKLRNYELDYIVFGNQVKIEENIQSFDLPIMFGYTFFPQNRMKLKFSAGPYGGFTFQSYNNLNISNAERNTEVKHYSSKARRNLWNYGICAGIGTTVNAFKKGHVSFSLLYFKSVSNIAKAVTRYDNPTLIYDYNYIDDDMYLDNLSLSIGYHYYFNYKLQK